MDIHARTPLLVLWDIDHTLLDGGGTGRDAYASTFRSVVGRPMQHPWTFDGRTELAAVTQVLHEHGVRHTDGTVERFLDGLVASFQDDPDGLARKGRVLPGATAALAAMGSAPDVRQTVLTGNLYPIAVLKMTTFGLDQHVDLRIGAYGGDAYERTDLPAHAFARAREHLGRHYTGSDAVIVGDTVRDVATARAAGARAVAVATGTASAAELAAAGADVVLPDLSDTTAVVRAVTGHRT